MKPDEDRPSSVCLVRFHDGSAKPNWGGRGTSLALARVIARSPRHRLDSVVNGELIVRGFGDRAATARRNRVARAARRAVRGRMSRQEILDSRTADFEQIPAEVDRLVADRSSNPTVDVVLRKFERCDEVWVNGEGDFILAGRRSLLRTLLLMHLATRCGRSVHLVNSILSDPPIGTRNAAVVDAVGTALRACERVVYRDPESLRHHEVLYPDVPARWAPDALFVWAPEGEALHAAVRPPFGPDAEGIPTEVEEVLAGDRPVVSISGSSTIRARDEDLDLAGASLSRLITGLRMQHSVPLVVATDGADGWMLDVARREACLRIDPSVPLASALGIAGRSDLFVSGRYHPSILASLGGTPIVTMASNSHKTRSLLEVLDEPGEGEFPFLTDPSAAERLLDHTASRFGRSAPERDEDRRSRRRRAQVLAEAATTTLVGGP